jgi:hypothetical protein
MKNLVKRVPYPSQSNNAKCNQPQSKQKQEGYVQSYSNGGFNKSVEDIIGPRVGFLKQYNRLVRKGILLLVRQEILLLIQEVLEVLPALPYSQWRSCELL